MKKKLLALTVTGMFSGAAFAQSGVTVYGITDVGISYTDNGATANSKTISLDSGMQSPSRIGFKGSEDLGGGMSVNFQLENGFDLSTGQISQTGRIFGRQAWVGLSGGFGSVALGRQWAPMFLALDEIDPFDAGLAGDATRMFGSGLYPLRMDNAVNYSLNSGAFTGQLAYAFGETAGSTSANRQIGARLGYVNGPVDIQFGYHKANVTAAPVVADTKLAFLGGTYDFGVVKAHIGYADNKLDSNVAGGSASTRNWMIGASVPAGAGTVLASYIRNNVRDVANANSSQFAVGYTYPLSKRTNLYTSYGHVSNDAAVALGGAAAPGDGVSIFNVGIRHTF